MKKTFLILALLFSISFADENFKKANDAFAKGEYKSAIENYEESIRLNGEHPDVYFNMANAYYKLDRWGLAILNYEKALRHSPADEKILKNLSLAESQKLDNQGEISFKPLSLGEKIIYKMSLNHLLLVISILALIFLLASFWFKSSRSKKREIYYPFCFVLFICALPIMGIFSFRVFSFETNNLAIVLENKTALYSSPFEQGLNRENSTQAKVLKTLNEGTKLNVKSFVDGWYQVALDDNYEGFVKQSALGLVRSFQ